MRQGLDLTPCIAAEDLVGDEEDTYCENLKDACLVCRLLQMELDEAYGRGIVSERVDAGRTRAVRVVFHVTSTEREKGVANRSKFAASRKRPANEVGLEASEDVDGRVPEVVKVAAVGGVFGYFRTGRGPPYLQRRWGSRLRARKRPAPANVARVRVDLPERVAVAQTLTAGRDAFGTDGPSLITFDTSLSLAACD